MSMMFTMIGIGITSTPLCLRTVLDRAENEVSFAEGNGNS
jgi:hypothetical protein